MTDDIFGDAERRMQKAVEILRQDLTAIRTGRASSSLVERIQVDYYGSPTPINGVANISAPDPRMVVVQPWDRSMLGPIEKAIQKSDLGINPTNDGQVIRLSFPQLTEERRKDLVKVVKHKAEEGRVAVRNLRRSARHELEALEKDGHVSSDDLDWAGKELDKLTHEYVVEIDRMVQHKEHELLEV